MPTNHRMDCACAVCTQKRAGVAKRQDLDRKRAAIAKMQKSHAIVKTLNRVEAIARMTATYATIAYNVSRIALWCVPTLAGIFALLRFLLWLI